MKKKIPTLKDIESGKYGMKVPKGAEIVFNNLKETDKLKVKEITEDKSLSFRKKMKALVKIFKKEKHKYKK